MRCSWATSELLIAYHDAEWGRLVHDDRTFFEFLVLEGAQAGLSWETVLRKRDRYRELFHGFDPARVARIPPARVEKLMADAGIIRNRAKIESTIGNARAFLDIVREFGSFQRYVLPFIGGEALDHRIARADDTPAESPESQALSRDLRKRGFRFVGPTIVYAFMQATGLINDHLLSCNWHDRASR
jgi:DNA-3-methyladenine glycosylase I